MTFPARVHFSTVFAAAFFAASAASALEPLDTFGEGGVGQLGAPVEVLPVPDSNGLYLTVQKSRDGRLFLTPNESFFPKLGLLAAGAGAVPDVGELNGGQSFATLTDWDEGDQAEWGLWLTRAGEIEIFVWTAGASGRFTATLGGQTQAFSAAGGGDPRATRALTFSIEKPGRHSLVIDAGPGAGKGTQLHWIEVNGPAAEGGAVVRKRWRPAAAHTRLSSSKAPKDVRLWVMEMDAVPGDLDYYSPVTTPFGYYGPTWNADGTVGTGFNFSLWSFGRGEKEPPVEQLSHLLAIGNPDASFGGFDHEGTGVKIRDWEPLEGRNGQRQALALRVEPGGDYDTYYSYFHAADEKRWRLFGVGRKFTGGKTLESLWVGSFVEVPGPPPRQRSGVYERTMRYRGAVMDERGRWYPIDRLSQEDVDKANGLTHTDRGVAGDGWLYMQTGGWFFRKPAGESFDLPAGAPTLPAAYLDKEAVAALTSMPSEIRGEKIERRGDQARISFTVRNLGRGGEVTIYHGEDEALTFAGRWPESERVPGVREGANQHILKGLPEGKPLKVRLLLKNGEGQFWSFDTLSDD